MKKISYILMALALVLGLSQCKKDKEDTKTPAPVGDPYSISVTVGGGPDAKAQVWPYDNMDIAPVYYEDGVNYGTRPDTIHVVYRGKWVGYLTCTKSTIPSDHSHYNEAKASFSGTINVEDGQIDNHNPLYFIFLGNYIKTKTLTAGTTATLTVDISDQTGEQLPVISYAASKEAFRGAGQYTVYNEHNAQGANWLLNQCALVKFTCENIYNMSANSRDNNPYAIYKTTKDITIYGMDNKVTITLSDGNAPTFGWSDDGSVGTGAIKLHKLQSDPGAIDSVRYAIIHQGDYTSVTSGDLDVPFDPASDDYGFYGTYKIAHDVEKNDYFDGAKLDLVWHSGAFTVGHHPGASLGDTTASGGIAPSDLLLDEANFDDFHYIVFSRGNLQYNNNQNTWRFAKHQYDFVGGGLGILNNEYLGNVVLDETNSASPALSSSSNANRSDNEQIRYADSYIGWIDLYGWGTGDNPMKDTQTNSSYADYHEWGAHPIDNDGTKEPGTTTYDSYDNPFWYALGRDEWQWLIESRCSGTASTRIGFATVNGVKGMILLPDKWNPGTDQPADCPAWEVAGTNPESSSWSKTYSEAQWKSMELKGAVFLPAAGYRGSIIFNTHCWDFDGGSGGHVAGFGTIGTDQNWGAYWSKTKATQVTNASCFYMRFGQGIPDDHVNAGYYMAPDNGNAVRLVHRVSSSKSLLNFPKKP